jgi:hypothetical protein
LPSDLDACGIEDEKGILPFQRSHAGGPSPARRVAS